MSGTTRSTKGWFSPCLCVFLSLPQSLFMWKGRQWFYYQRLRAETVVGRGYTAAEHDINFQRNVYMPVCQSSFCRRAASFPFISLEMLNIFSSTRKDPVKSLQVAKWEWDWWNNSTSVQIFKEQYWTYFCFEVTCDCVKFFSPAPKCKISFNFQFLSDFV